MTLPAVATAADAADPVLVGGTVHSLARGGDTVHEALAGRTAVPGFIETHSHPSFYGLTLRAAVDAGSPTVGIRAATTSIRYRHTIPSACCTSRRTSAS